MINELRKGCVYTPRRHTGDGGVIDEHATNCMLNLAADEIKLLRERLKETGEGLERLLEKVKDNG